MTSINTTLTTSGNSVAVRLPKELLKMSGLKNNVRLEAKQGKIIISKNDDPREGWAKQIKQSIKLYGDPTSEFKDMAASNLDGLEDAPWDGPTYEEWLAAGGKFS